MRGGVREGVSEKGVRRQGESEEGVRGCERRVVYLAESH